MTVHLQQETLRSGDVFLLCTDGLSDLVDEKDIELIVDSLKTNLPLAASHLAQLANDNGGYDNITVALVRVLADEAGAGARGWISRLLGRLKKQGREEHGALRVAVVGGGCSGLQYKMDLVDGPANRDIMVISSEVRVVIDPKRELFVSGSELDYRADLQSGGLPVHNPPH